MIVSLVLAASANEVIGAGGALPWYLPGDLRRFRALTTGHVVVMGRLTYESILDRLGHPLTRRTSIVVSRTLGDPGYPEVLVARSIPEALALAEWLAAEAGDSEFFIIGGESVYRDTLPLADRVYLTRVHGEVAGDRAMDDGWLAGFELAARDDDAGAQGPLRYSFLDYRRAQR
jgi:dihydrofolate reductase